MTFIGNDIIDLHDAIHTYKHKNYAWINKAFTPEEQSYIFNSTNPSLTLWELWSCKESAYKVVVKREKQRFLNPKKMVCQKCQLGMYKVKYNLCELWVKVHRHPQYIHSICAPTSERILDCQYEVLSFSSLDTDRSEMVRRALSVRLRSEWGNHIQIEYCKSELGVPFVNTNSMNIDISFSHDSSFSAYLFAHN